MPPLPIEFVPHKSASNDSSRGHKREETEEENHYATHFLRGALISAVAATRGLVDAVIAAQVEAAARVSIALLAAQRACAREGNCIIRYEYQQNKKKKKHVPVQVPRR